MGEERRDVRNGALRDFETGTGFAGAKLSEILPAARVARFVRMTEKAYAISYAVMRWKKRSALSARIARFSSADRRGLFTTSSAASGNSASKCG